jgi:IclR family transcriptional regulator, KDG regulon repressor
MLLNCFQGSAAPREQSLKELVQQLQLPQTVVSRLAATLVEYGYLYQNEANRKYRLGLAVFTLGFAADPHLELKTAARPWMERLALETGESISLNVVDAITGDGICIASLDSPNQIKLTTVVGSIRPLHRGATRKVLMANLSTEKQHEYFTRLRLSAEEQATLESELDTIRKEGYAVSEEELDKGAFAIAAPIFTRNGVLLGSIAVLGPLFRHTQEERQMWIEPVLQAAKNIGQLTTGSQGSSI